jgi:serine/threonine protein kinase
MKQFRVPKFDKAARDNKISKILKRVDAERAFQTKINNPNIVKITDSNSQTKTGEPYVIMELANGP